MADSDTLDVDGATPSTEVAGPTFPPSRYRRPGDVIRLIISGLVLLATLLVAVVAPDRSLGARATTVTGLEPSTAAGRLLVGLVQLASLLAALALTFELVRRRRFRLLASLAGGAVLAGLALIGLMHLVGEARPAVLVAGIRRGSWLTGAAFPSPAFLAGAVLVTVSVGPWLSRSWRRAAWSMLGGAGVARLIAGTVLPMELVLAFATGATVGAALLVVLGAPDRRIRSAGIGSALAASGVPVSAVVGANVLAKGSRPFIAIAPGGRRLFVKVLGADERNADLLYRAQRFVRLRGVGDTRPAASLRQAVEHQALVGMTAERAGVSVARVEGVAEAADGSALLAMELVDGTSLDRAPAEVITDSLLWALWAEVDRLHRARIAHRGLRAANVMVDGNGRPRIVDFSFSELAATDRQIALDVAELLASLTTVVGPERAVASAVAGVGARGLAPAVVLLQPLALSAATRHAIAGHGDLLGRTRAAATAAAGQPASELAQLQRVRPRSLLIIAVAAGAFYFVLPHLAQVGSSWRAFQSADWVWLPLVIVMSLLTYVGGNIGIMGSVPQPLPFGPTLLTQSASSFVNRVSPANVGGMALNIRYLQKSGVDPTTALAAVGLNSLAGAIVHLVLIVVFFAWSGNGLGKAFKLPSSSTVLVVVAVLAAVAGAVVVTRWGRRTLLRKLLGGLRSSAANLRQVATNPVKLTMLFGGSGLVTLAYIGALAASVQAFGGGVAFATIGAVYLGASALAAAAPTPGGLGAIEAALVAGLTGVGMKTGPAVSAVLTYRLATYWLPVLPGWLSWHLLQRRQYV